MKKNEKTNMNKMEEKAKEMNGIRQECLDCPDNQDCPFAVEEINGSMDRPAAQEDSCLERDELRELDEAVNELVDSLFNVIDKVAEAARYLKKLDDLTDAALDYLSAIGVSQLDQED